MSYDQNKYQEHREKLLRRERERLLVLKQNPEKYQAYLDRKKANYQKRKAEGRINTNTPSKKAWEERNRQRLRDKTNKRRLEDRLEALTVYGGKCACCSENKFEFLSIDHINGGGAKHRASLRPTDRREFPRYLKKLGYPDGYRVLCHNCNQALGVYGFCPHNNLTS